MLRAFLAGADVHQHVVAVFVAHALSGGFHRTRHLSVRKAQAMLAHLAHQLVVAHLQIVAAVCLREVVPDLRTRRRRADDAQPAARRRGAFLREDLNAVAHLQLVRQRHDLAVGLGTNAVVADLGVNGVGEVDRSGTRTQALDLALRGEHEHLVGIKVDLQVFQELARILGFILPVNHLSKPRQLLIELGVLALLAAVFLIQPVSRDTELAFLVHFLGADLNLKRLAGRADDRGVQALVHVELRHGDVVFETPGHRVPQRMHRAQRRVTVLNGLHDQAHGDQVEDLAELLVALGHFLIDRVQVLGTAHDLGLDADLLHLVVQKVDDLLQVCLARCAAFSNQALDLLILRGLKVVERQVL